jgi:ornithine lipid hydroxylase
LIADVEMRTILSHTLWPGVVVAGTWGTYLGFRTGYPLPIVFLAVNVAMLVFVGVAEQVLPHRRDWNALTDRQSINDLGHALVENQIGDRLGGLVFLTLAAILAGRLTTLLGHSAWPSDWPLVGQICLVVFVGDGLDYWKHRLLHTVPWLWRIHALHHGITQLHIFKASRLHFTDVLARFVVVYSPLAILGAPAELVFWYTSFISIFGVIGHSNVELRVPPVFHRLLMTPQVHRLHHSIERALSDTNYINIFPFWDILFGTFSHPDEHGVEDVGVVGDPIPAGFLGQFLSPFMWGRLVAKG